MNILHTILAVICLGAFQTEARAAVDSGGTSSHEPASSARDARPNATGPGMRRPGSSTLFELAEPGVSSARLNPLDASPALFSPMPAPLSLTEPADGIPARDIAAGAPDTGSESIATKLQNPIADLISVPLQLNYDDGYGPNDAGRFTLNIQPVIPFSLSQDLNLITRTIFPVIYQDSVAEGVDSDFGLGDTVQSFWLAPKEKIGGWFLGAGPVALWPTGTDPQLRSETLGFGPTVVALRQDKGWTFGALANHIWSVTNSDDHEQVNATFVQPFVAYTWPTATSIALNSETTYDWSGKEWTIPLNLMVSQLVKFGDQPVQFQIGGRYYAASPEEGAEWGLRFAVVFVFPK